jgi:hypothetical protein
MSGPIPSICLRGGKARLADALELPAQLAILFIEKRELRRGRADQRLALTRQDSAAGCGVCPQRGDRLLCGEVRERGLVLGVALQQQIVESVDEPGEVLGQLGLRAAPELHRGQLVLVGVHPRQRTGLFAQQRCDAARVEAIALARAAHPAAPRGGPAAIHFMHALALAGQILRQAAAQEPRALDRPDPLRPLLGPLEQRRPGLGRVGNGPLSDRTLRTEREGLVHLLVCVDADPDHRLPPSGSETRGRRRHTTLLTRVNRPAPIKSERRRRLCRTDDSSREGQSDEDARDAMGQSVRQPHDDNERDANVEQCSGCSW